MVHTQLCILCSMLIPKIAPDIIHGCSCPMHDHSMSWWRHHMEKFSALLAIRAGYSPVPGEFPAQRQVTRSFDAFFDLRLNKRLSKHSWGWWFETLSRPSWRHRNIISWPGQYTRQSTLPNPMHIHLFCSGLTDPTRNFLMQITEVNRSYNYHVIEND